MRSCHARSSASVVKACGLRTTTFGDPLDHAICFEAAEQTADGEQGRAGHLGDVLSREPQVDQDARFHGPPGLLHEPQQRPGYPALDLLGRELTNCTCNSWSRADTKRSAFIASFGYRSMRDAITAPGHSYADTSVTASAETGYVDPPKAATPPNASPGASSRSTT